MEHSSKKKITDLDKIDNKISKLVNEHKKGKLDEVVYQKQLNRLLKEREKLNVK